MTIANVTGGLHSITRPATAARVLLSYLSGNGALSMLAPTGLPTDEDAELVNTGNVHDIPLDLRADF